MHVFSTSGQQISNPVFVIEPFYSGTLIIRTSIIWTCSTQLNTLICMCRGRDQLPFGVVVTVDEELGHVRACRGLPRPKPTDLCICMNDVDHDYARVSYRIFR